jgi:hypothetical protein
MRLSRIRISASLLFFVLNAHSLQAKTLVISYPGLIEQEGLLQPSVLFGQPGLSFETMLSTGRLPSKLSFTGAFPLFDQDTLRSSGWMWAIRGGFSSFMYEEDRVFAASHHFVETGFGRGTSAPLIEGSSGLRGYMEATFRTERPRHSSEVQDISEALNRSMREKKDFIGLKIGAGSALDAEGLVRQKPGIWAFRVQTQVYLPLSESSSSILNVMAQGFRACPTLSWLCGIHLSYLSNFHAVNVEESENFEELQKLMGIGVFVNHFRAKSFNLNTRLTWPLLVTQTHRSFEKIPIVHFQLTRGF